MDRLDHTGPMPRSLHVAASDLERNTFILRTQKENMAAEVTLPESCLPVSILTSVVRMHTLGSIR